MFRLLFLSVHWARRLPVFRSLPYSTQVGINLTRLCMYVHIMCILCAIVYMFKTCHTQKADHLWKVIFPWYQYNFSMNHHHKQVSLMRNSWSDLFLLGLVQVTNYNKTISLDVINLMLTYGYLSHLERRLSIYFIHSHSAAPNCAFPLSCLHWQVNFLTGWKKTDFLCKGKLLIAVP